MKHPKVCAQPGNPCPEFVSDALLEEGLAQSFGRKFVEVRLPGRGSSRKFLELGPSGDGGLQEVITSGKASVCPHCIGAK